MISKLDIITSGFINAIHGHIRVGDDIDSVNVATFNNDQHKQIPTEIMDLCARYVNISDDYLQYHSMSLSPPTRYHYFILPKTRQYIFSELNISKLPTDDRLHNETKVCIQQPRKNKAAKCSLSLVILRDLVVADVDGLTITRAAEVSLDIGGDIHGSVSLETDAVDMKVAGNVEADIEATSWEGDISLSVMGNIVGSHEIKLYSAGSVGINVGGNAEGHRVFIKSNGNVGLYVTGNLEMKQLEIEIRDNASFELIVDGDIKLGMLMVNIMGKGDVNIKCGDLMLEQSLQVVVEGEGDVNLQCRGYRNVCIETLNNFIEVKEGNIRVHVLEDYECEGGNEYFGDTHGIDMTAKNIEMICGGTMKLPYQRMNVEYDLKIKAKKLFTKDSMMRYIAFHCKNAIQFDYEDVDVTTRTCESFW